MREKDVHVRAVTSLSQAQCDKLAELSAPLGPTQRLWIQQTVTDTGGAHLYVRNNHSGQEWHVNVKGEAVELGPDRPKAPGTNHKDQVTPAQAKADREAEELRIARRVIDRYGPPPPGEGTHPLQRHRDSMG